MANQVVTDIDNGGVAVGQSLFEHDGVMNFSGADTLVAGTILARNTDTKKWQIYAKGGSTNGNGVPRGVLTYDVVATGSGDLSVSPLIDGHVNLNRLVIDADGDGSNVDANVLDLLRSTGIVPLDVQQVGLTPTEAEES